MSKKDPIVVFKNGEENFEKLMEKLIYRKLKKIGMKDKEADEMIYSKGEHNGYLPKHS